VHEVNSGLEATLPGGFRYTPAMQLTSFSGANVQPATGPFTPLTLHGQGFDAPVAVSLAGIVATVISVSATEIIVLPNFPLVSGCSDVGGSISVTNVDSGETASGLSFTYLVQEFGPVITGMNPSSAQVGAGGLDLTITGANLFNAEVKFGTASVPVIAASANGASITVHIPPFAGDAPDCPTGTPDATPVPTGGVDVVVTNRSTGCSATFTEAFTYLVPCVAPAAP
jgi:hypothetical protein